MLFRVLILSSYGLQLDIIVELLDQSYKRFKCESNSQMCVHFPDNRYCICFVTVSSDCINEQRDYDEALNTGSLGLTQVRPICDEKGDYGPAHCIGGSM